MDDNLSSESPGDQQELGASFDGTEPGQLPAHTNIPPGIPEGLPKDMWIEYLKIQSHERIQMKHMEMAQAQAPAQAHTQFTTATMSHGNCGLDKIRVPKLRESDDIDIYLKAFENLAQMNGWPSVQWSARLVPELTGKAREAYAALTLAEAKDYDVLKNAILDRYEINAETYRTNFRKCVRKGTETVRDWVTELSHQYNNWLKFADIDSSDPSQIIDLMVMDQAMSKLPYDLKIHLRDKKPQSCRELANMADTYVANRGGSEFWRKNEISKTQWRSDRNKNATTKQTYSSGRSSHNSSDRSDSSISHESGKAKFNLGQLRTTYRCELQDSNGQVRPKSYVSMSDRQCYHCKEYGHISSFCPMKSDDTEGSSSSSGSSQTGSGVSRKTEKSNSDQSKPKNKGVNPKAILRCETTVESGADQVQFDSAEMQLEKCVLLGTLEGKQVRILRDSACTQTAVKASLVPSACY